MDCVAMMENRTLDMTPGSLRASSTLFAICHTPKDTQAAVIAVSEACNDRDQSSESKGKNRVTVSNTKRLKRTAQNGPAAPN